MIEALRDYFGSKGSPLSEAERALTKWGIAYQKQPDGKILVDGDLEISDKKLTALPDLTNVIVTGSFKCCRNKLTSLKGCPQSVGKDFWCYGNELTDLRYAPKYIPGDFQAHCNKITTLKDGPEETGGEYIVSDNQLTTLEHGPRKIGGTCGLSRNPLISLKYLTTEIGGSLCVQGCGLKTLEYAPEVLGDQMICHENPLETLEHAPQTFTRLNWDQGEYPTWDAIPENLVPDRARRKEERVIAFTTGATTLQAPIKTRGPLRFKSA